MGLDELDEFDWLDYLWSGVLPLTPPTAYLPPLDLWGSFCLTSKFTVFKLTPYKKNP